MRILSLTLNGYIRLGLGKFEEITITPTSRLQIILGTNGSGKSSLLDELTPLPPKRQDFSEGGFKSITVEKQGRVYTLTSTFTGSGPGKHSFVDEQGTELNQGGTGQVQLALVQQYFQLTPELHQLFTGKIAFTDMNANERKYWFTKFSTENYDFAIAYYNQLRQRMNDTKGAIKQDKRYLVEETRKLIPPEEIATLRKQQEELLSLINDAQAIVKPKDMYSDVQSNKNDVMAAIASLNSILARSLGSMQRDYDHSYEQRGQTTRHIESLIEKLGQDISVAQHVLTDKGGEYQELLHAKELLSQRSAETVQALEARLQEVSTNSHTTLAMITTTVHEHIVNQSQGLEVAIDAYNQFKLVSGNVIEILQVLPTNDPSRPYGRKELEELIFQSQQFAYEQRSLEERIQSIDEGIRKQQHEHRDGEVSCPKCEHTWSLKDNASIIREMESKRQELSAKLTDPDRLQVETDRQTYLAECRQYVEQMQGLQQTMRALKGGVFADTFISALYPIDQIRSNPARLVGVTLAIEADLANWITVWKNAAEIQDINTKLDINKHAEQYDINEVERKLAELDRLLGDANHVILEATQEIETHRRYLSLVRTIEDTRTKLELAVDDAWQYTAQEVSAALNDAVHERIRDMQIGLAQLTHRLSGIDRQVAIVEATENKIKEQEAALALLECFVANLSPEKGLIADGLVGFINAFIKQMNIGIRKVWTYPMVIASCEFEEGSNASLNYKFPMRVANRIKPVPDVSDSSAGMAEIINLVYRLTAMKYMGMSDYPLQLDELGSKMDETHRLKVVDLIKAVLDQENFSQLFIVSHDSKQYGALSNAELCVIHGDNVTIPEGMVANKHVVFA